MKLRPAIAKDSDFVRDLWAKPRNAAFLDIPQDAEVQDAIEAGDILLWHDGTVPVGFAYLQEWVPEVWGLRAFATDVRGQGKVFLDAVLTEVFTKRGGHRLGLDTTVDNAIALRLFEAAGFQREGVWRECWRRPSGDWVDCVFMALLRREWQT